MGRPHHHCSDVVETKNRSLEETAAMFDGDEATQQISGAAHAKVDEPHDEKHSDISFEEHKTTVWRLKTEFAFIAMWLFPPPLHI